MSYLKSKDGSIEASIKEMQKNLNDNAYQKLFKKELEKAGKGIGAMSDMEKKDFFNNIDKKYKGKNEDLNKKALKESTDINFMKGDGAEVSYLKRHGSFMGGGKYYKFRGVNINFFVYYNEKNKNYVQQLKLTSGNRPSNDREYDKMYDVLKKLGNEKRLGKLDDSDVDIYFEGVNEAKVDELTSAQKKLPPALQKAIKDKEDKKESVDGEINQKKHDSYNDPKKGEKKPVVTQEEESFDVEKLKEDVNTLWSNAAKDLEEMKKNSKYMKAQDVTPNNDADGESEKTKGKTLVGSAKTKVETEPKIDYQK